MFLTSRFFLSLAALAVVSVGGMFVPVLYPVAQAATCALVLLLLADALLLTVSGKVEAARNVADRLSNGEDNDVCLAVRNCCRIPLSLTVVDELPREFLLHQASFPLKLKSRESKSIHYTLRPVERGSYEFGQVLVYVSSPLGLWQRKRRFGDKTTAVKVYPSYLHLDRYELAAANAQTLQNGQKRVRRAGNSTEFEQIKDYVVGDDFRTINWKASARTARWMVNVYRDERSQPVWFLLDKGRTMQRTFDGMTLIDYAINATLVLSHVAARRYDMPGLVSFDAHISQTVTAENRADQMHRILNALYAETCNYAETDYSALCAHISRHIHRRSLLMLFTDFTTRDALLRQMVYLRRLARHHCLLVVLFDDPDLRTEAQKPAQCFDDMKFQTLAADALLEMRTLCTELRRNGIYTLFTTPQNLTVAAVNKYIELKSLQAV